jgi:hypothetical protein
MLADTGDALEANCMGQSEQENPNITLIATLPQCTYQSLPKQMSNNLHQWMDYVASINALKDAGDEGDSSKWKLVIKACPVFDLSLDGEKPATSSSVFKIVDFYDSHHEICQEIVWNV